MHPHRTVPGKSLLSAFRAAEPLLTGNRELSRTRRAVIVGNPPFQERELAKSLALTLTLAAALRERGVPEGTASLTAAIGMAALAQAFTTWLDDDDSSLAACIDDVIREVGNLTKDSQ